MRKYAILIILDEDELAERNPEITVDDAYSTLAGFLEKCRFTKITKELYVSSEGTGVVEPILVFQDLDNEYPWLNGFTTKSARLLRVDEDTDLMELLSPSPNWP
jgi:virulence-associated protein VapD